MQMRTKQKSSGMLRDGDRGRAVDTSEVGRGAAIITAQETTIMSHI